MQQLMSSLSVNDWNSNALPAAVLWAHCWQPAGTVVYNGQLCLQQVTA
jgi:hypothetical protein